MTKLLACILLFPLWLSSLGPSSPASVDGVVKAVLFYSPNCGHCHLVITETLPPLVEKYGSQLFIVGVDVSQPGGQSLFMATLEHFNLQSGGVPLLVVGDTYLVGSVDIPGQFPVLIEHYLSQGGVGWPDIPGMAEAMQAAEESVETSTPATQTAATPTTQLVNTPSAQVVATQEAIPSTPAATPTNTGVVLTGDFDLSPWERVAIDPAGNGLSIVVLVGMIVSAAWGFILFRRASGAMPLQDWNWLVPALCIIGLGVAGYLSYVETAHVEAVCGPVGDCNTVQQSKYAVLFGILPIGVLGMIGYVMILLAWGVERLANRQQSAYASLAILGMTSFGLLFSIYLTFLEPFVIGATCAWCLTSAILMTALFWLSLAPGRSALSYLRPRKKKKR